MHGRVGLDLPAQQADVVGHGDAEVFPRGDPQVGLLDHDLEADLARDRGAAQAVGPLGIDVAVTGQFARDICWMGVQATTGLMGNWAATP